MFDKSLFAKLENKKGYDDTAENEILNPYVNFHAHTNSQSLHDYLAAESIQMRGVECFYIRREFVNFDHIFGEDLQNKFKKAYKVAVYINSFDGFEGQKDFFSKFGMQVNDEVSLSISPQLFNHQCDGQDAREGDLIYWPMDNSLFEVTWVERKPAFFQLGKNSIYKVTAQKFVYSGEEIDVKFDPSKFTDDDDLIPINNLDNRQDINEPEFAEDKQISDEADEFVIEFDNLIGTGEPISPRPKDDDPFADITF
ncbi:MAG: hypothetical protein ACRC3J_05580 [Culicoidibacterales bacterium]